MLKLNKKKIRENLDLLCYMTLIYFVYMDKLYIFWSLIYTWIFLMQQKVSLKTLLKKCWSHYIQKIEIHIKIV